LVVVVEPCACTLKERLERDPYHTHAPAPTHNYPPNANNNTKKQTQGSWDALGIHFGTSGQGGTWADDTVKNIVKQHNKFVNAY
jgi:hypothetical protein